MFRSNVPFVLEDIQIKEIITKTNYSYQQFTLTFILPPKPGSVKEPLQVTYVVSRALEEMMMGTYTLGAQYFLTISPTNFYLPNSQDKKLVKYALVGLEQIMEERKPLKTSTTNKIEDEDDLSEFMNDINSSIQKENIKRLEERIKEEKETEEITENFDWRLDF